jgi:hypothetical protein
MDRSGAGAHELQRKVSTSLGRRARSVARLRPQSGQHLSAFCAAHCLGRRVVLELLVGYRADEQLQPVPASAWNHWAIEQHGPGFLLIGPASDHAPARVPMDAVVAFVAARAEGR